MHHLLYTSEQHECEHLTDLPKHLKLILAQRVYQKFFYYKPDLECFKLYNENEEFRVNTNYFVGVDWLVKDKVAIYIEPKLNNSTHQVNVLSMLLESLQATKNLEHLQGLYHVDYELPWINIPQQKDLLSPILIIQFLKLLQKIVRKGLKKSYYRVTANLDSKIKGRILIGQQIKENFVKNRFTKTLCNYQEYGTNSFENQYLKLVLSFVSSWLSQKQTFFGKDHQLQMFALLNYCQPAFENVEKLKNKHQNIHCVKNIFYREYEEAIKIGGYILKRFSFNINKINSNQASTPPFWIDMSKLFELYVFQKLKKVFPEPNLITYHDNFNKKETDILIKADGYKCVIDCKYKPRYHDQSPSLEDKRQLAGYTRLKSVYHVLGIPRNQIVKGLIVYSHQDAPSNIDKMKIFETQIAEYIDFFKIGLSLPII